MARMYRKRNLAKARRAKQRRTMLTYENTRRVYAFHTKTIKESIKLDKLARAYAKKGQVFIPKEGELTAYRGKKAKPTEKISRVFSPRWETKLAQHAVAHKPFGTEQNIYGESTAIHSMGYNPDKRVLILTFWKYKQKGPGGTYLYYNVPLEVWKALQLASSKGRYFWYFIRGRFNFRRLK